MEHGSVNRPEYEPAEECGEKCENCQVPVTNACQSCGMPMVGPGDYGGGNIDNSYCVHCCLSDGSLKNFSDVLEGMTGLMMTMRGLDRTAAESAARDYLITMPAWCGR